MSTLRNTHIHSTLGRPFPPNVVIGLPHGSSWVPDDFYSRLTPEMRANDNLLLTNFSDEGTIHLLADDVPKDQLVMAQASRAVGDPNRARDAGDLFRDDDFNEVILWSEPPTPEEREDLLCRYYDPYHERTEALLQALEQRNPQGKLIYIDLHDTGNLMMKPDSAHHTSRLTKPPQNKLMPPMCLSYQDGWTCDKAIFETFVELMAEHTKLPISIDDPYPGGYLIRHYGGAYNDALPPEARFRRNCIQIEVGRFLYVDEATQTLRDEATLKLRAALMEAICELGFLYSK